jgi:Bacterial SH3 domain
MPTPKQTKNNKNNPAPQKEPFKLRPLEMFGVALLLFAVFFFAIRGCGSSKKPTSETLPVVADSTQLAVKASNLRPLYVIIDSLKLRSRPQLDSSFIRYLSYDEIVYDMGEQTQYMQTIRYSLDEIRTEPWVKVRTKQGEIGWVFGAGVNFYKKRRRTPTIGSDSTTRNTTISQPSITPAVTTSQPSSATVSRPSGR